MSYLAIVKAAEARLRAEREKLATPPPSPSEAIDPFDPVEIAVSWYERTLWFVPSERDAETLAKEGVSRSRIWTAKELRNLLDTPGLTTEGVKQIATAKRIFEGTVREREQ